ncbi:MAG: hypothetical protein PWR12_1997 [Eubacteriaceae bacterium]|nr:hypothetical protein [Eubacteriaceae bacterium]MDK2935886.1 hypothetical protein [Eubacteriaceae bacterium]MDK2961661.1 hypothetical protein [Eubacteriaceae bacterium]
MEQFLNNMASAAWTIIPILALFFLMAGIMFVFYVRMKMDEWSHYLKSIAVSLEKLSNRRNDYYDNNGGRDVF